MRRRSILIAGLPLILSGCGASILPKPTAPPLLYQLTALPPSPPQGGPVDAQLVVEPPSASASLDTPRIALTRGAFGFDYFADAAWTERAPAMVQALVVESIENAGRFRVVSAPAGELRPDAALASDLRRFEAAYAGGAPPQVEIWLDCRLVRLSDFTVLAVRSFRATTAASSDGIDAIVAAFDAALHDAIRELPAWTAAALAGRPR